jgi:M6 family metalloprotease-like protein
LATDIRITPATDMDSVDACKIADLTDTHSATTNSPSTSGFPRREMASTPSSLRLLVVPVSMPDLPYTEENHAALIEAMAEFGRFFDAVSYGRTSVSYDVVPFNEITTLSASAASFDLIPGDNADTWRLMEAAAQRVSASLDLDNYDVIAFDVGDDPAAQFWGTAFPMQDNPITAPNGEIRYATLSGGWQPASWRLIAHEVAHVWLGLEDLYTTEPNPNYDGTFRFWDLMNSYRGDAPEFIAWHRFLTGWLPDDQVRCVAGSSPSSTVHFLSPIQSDDKAPKAIMRPLNEGKILVVESRRVLGYDTAPPGVLVYVFDTSIPGGKGPVTALGELTLDPNRQRVEDRFFITLAQSVTAEGVRITLEESDESGDLLTFIVE